MSKYCFRGGDRNVEGVGELSFYFFKGVIDHIIITLIFERVSVLLVYLKKS